MTRYPWSLAWRVRYLLLLGRVDAAMQLVVQAKKRHRLDAVAGITAKEAHLVRAGLAAGRLLGSGTSLADMFGGTKDQPIKAKLKVVK